MQGIACTISLHLDVPVIAWHSVGKTSHQCEVQRTHELASSPHSMGGAKSMRNHWTIILQDDLKLFCTELSQWAKCYKLKMKLAKLLMCLEFACDQ